MDKTNEISTGKFQYFLKLHCSPQNPFKILNDYIRGWDITDKGFWLCQDLDDAVRFDSTDEAHEWAKMYGLRQEESYYRICGFYINNNINIINKI